MHDFKTPTVAVIGLGAFGLVALKNLVEEGFDVTGFDRNSYIGGLWRFTTESQTSVLQSTLANVSKQRCCFTDFPFPKDVDGDGTDFPLAQEVAQYLEDYADHFNLRSHFRLSTPIKHIRRDDEKQGWTLTLEKSEETLFFDRVVVATGVNNVPTIPDIRGFDKFDGESIHSRDYKFPDRFKDKKVLVVGLGNSGGDTAMSLVGYASKIYVSHRVGAYVVPRHVNGRPADHVLTLRIERFRALCERTFPDLTARVFDRFLKATQDRCFNIKPEWGLSPAPSLKFSTPVVADTLIDHLEAGDIVSLPGVKEFLGGNEILLDDGRVVKADSIIWCTGYQADFGYLERCVDPTTSDTSPWDELLGSRGRPLLRLYQNIFSLQHPDSLAFIGFVFLAAPAFSTHDLASMALAQVWKGNSPLPSREEMEKSVDEHAEWICKLARRGRTHPAWVDWVPWTDWANRTAGTGLEENLGWGLAGWKFWLLDHKMYRLLMDGIHTPHAFRLFPTGKRKSWAGAREAIERVNRRV